MKRIGARKRKANVLRRAERGVALIIAMILILVLSVLAAGVLFATQAEIWSSANLRGTTQARYVAEAGVAQAMQWISSPNFAWTNIQTYIFDSSKCDYNNMPLTCTINGNKVQMVIGNNAGAGGVVDTWSLFNSWNSDFGAQDANFTSIFSNSSSSSSRPALSFFTNNTTGGVISTSSSDQMFGSAAGAGKFSVSLQLLQATRADSTHYRSKWKIVSIGTVAGAGGMTSNVQVTTIVENTMYQTNSNNPTSQPLFTAALQTTGTGCKTLRLDGGGSTGSYDSSVSNTAYVSNGDVRSNGGVQLTGGFYVGGKLYSSLTGVNSGLAHYFGTSGQPTYWGTGNGYAGSSGTTGLGCDSTHMFALNEGNDGSAVTGGLSSPATQYNDCWTGKSGSCPSGYNTTISIDASDVSAPNAPMTDPAASITNTSACKAVTGCNNEQADFILPPSTTKNYGDVTVSNCGTCVMHLQPGVYYMNSLSIHGKIALDLPSSCNATTISLPACNVTVNILGSTSSSYYSQTDSYGNKITQTALYMDGASVANSNWFPGNLLLQYNGSNAIYVDAGANFYGGIYAPNAFYEQNGGSGVYGGIISKTAYIHNPVGLSNGSAVTYDMALSKYGKTSYKNTPVLTQYVTSFHIDEFSWSIF